MSTEELNYDDLLGGVGLDKTEQAFIALLRFSQENARMHGLTTGKEAILLYRAYRAVAKDCEVTAKLAKKEAAASLPEHTVPIKLE